MKYVLLVSICFLSFSCFSQKKGFEFLSYAKSSLESVIIDYSAAIPDTSGVFKRHYFDLARYFNKAKASYDGYRGAMKDCILNNNSKKKIQTCLQSKTVYIQADLDSLEGVLEIAYLELSANQNNKEHNPSYNGKNSGLITSDFAKALFDSLLGGALKLWDQTQKYRKQYKDDYLTNITSKEYDLSELADLLKKRSTATLTK